MWNVRPILGSSTSRIVEFALACAADCERLPPGQDKHGRTAWYCATRVRFNNHTTTHRLVSHIAMFTCVQAGDVKTLTVLKDSEVLLARCQQNRDMICCDCV